MICIRTAVLLSTALLFSGAMADEVQDKTAYERELSSVKALMLALKNDPKSGEVSVKSVIDLVSARQKEAGDLAAAGEYEMAKSILHEGYVQLTSTLASVKSGSGYTGASGSMSGMSGMGGMTGSNGQPLALSKLKDDYARKLRSAESMQDAARRSDVGSREEISAVDNLINQAKSAAKKEDFVAANRYIDDGLHRQKTLFSNSSSSSSSAIASAPDSDYSTRDMTGMTGDDKKRAVISQLRSTKTLRDAYERKCKEKGSDCTAKLAEIDQKAAEARKMEGADSTRSLLAADEAYTLAKTSLAAQRAGY